MLCFTRTFYKFPCQQVQGDFYKLFCSDANTTHIKKVFFLCVWPYVWVPLLLIYSESCSGYNPKDTALAKYSSLLQYMEARRISVPQGLTLEIGSLTYLFQSTWEKSWPHTSLGSWAAGPTGRLGSLSASLPPPAPRMPYISFYCLGFLFTSFAISCCQLIV